jgi:hypothetical protein
LVDIRNFNVVLGHVVVHESDLFSIRVSECALWRHIKGDTCHRIGFVIIAGDHSFHLELFGDFDLELKSPAVTQIQNSPHDVVCRFMSHNFVARLYIKEYSSFFGYESHIETWPHFQFVVRESQSLGRLEAIATDLLKFDLLHH